MKKAIAIVVLGLLCNVSFADNRIPDLAWGQIEFKAPLSINGEFIDTKYEFKKKSKGNVDCLAFTKSPITSSYRSVPESKGTCKWEQDGTKFRIFHDKSNVYGKSIIEGVIDPSLGTIKGVIKYKGTNVSHDFSGVVWSSRYLEGKIKIAELEKEKLKEVKVKLCNRHPKKSNHYWGDFGLISYQESCNKIWDDYADGTLGSPEVIRYTSSVFKNPENAVCYNYHISKVTKHFKNCSIVQKRLEESGGKGKWIEIIWSRSDKDGDWFKPKNALLAQNNEDIEKNKKLEEERKKIAEEKRKLEEERKKITEEKRKIEEEKRKKEEEENSYRALVKNFGLECESSWRKFWTGHNVGTPEFDKCLIEKKQQNDQKLLTQKNKEEKEKKAKLLEIEQAKKAKQLEKEKAEKEIAKLTPDEKRAYTCKNTFGFRKGTDKFKDCVFQIYAAELELAKLEVEKQLAESQLEIAKANREAAEARAEATRQAALRAKAEANAAKAQKLTEQAQLEAAQALVEATNQQTAQMKANAKKAEQNALMSILSQRLGTAGSGACSIVNGNLKCY